MKIKWIGHACFVIGAKEGRIVTDPFEKDVPYDFPKIVADVVTVSHEHFDHNAVHRIVGDPGVVRKVGEETLNGIAFHGIGSYHDNEGGKQRGKNVLFAYTLEGIRLAHLGDLGAPLDDAQRKALKDVEVLFIPVGGHFTIDAKQAAEIACSLPALRVVIPMHFRTERIGDWPIETVDPFAEMMDNVKRIGGSEVLITRETLPESLEVWILDHA